MDTVVLIDPVEVREEVEQEFLRSWDATIDFLRGRPGFMGAQLARGAGPHGTVSFVSTSEWESTRAFLGAATAAESAHVGEAAHGPRPTLYEVARAARPHGGFQTSVAAA